MNLMMIVEGRYSMLGVRVQLSQPGLETPVRSAGHYLLWSAIPDTNSRQLERVLVLVGSDKRPEQGG